MNNRKGGADHLSPLKDFLSRPLPPSMSSVKDIYRETTICYAYMCPYAYGCDQQRQRPAQVMRRRCIRYLPDSETIAPGMSDFALDRLAVMREDGDTLASATLAILDELRPNGPIRKQV